MALTQADRLLIQQISHELKQINFQLKRLIVCSEARLAGRVIPDFDSQSKAGTPPSE